MYLGHIAVLRCRHHLDFTAGDESAAPETEPLVVEGSPWTPAVKLLQQIELFLRGKLDWCGYDGGDNAVTRSFKSIEVILVLP
jgi:hypothetical protein